MWKLPSNRIIKSAQPIQIGDTNYPKTIFSKWSTAELNSIGIFPYSIEKYDSRFYKSIAQNEVLTDGKIIVQHTIENRYTVPQIKKYFARLVKGTLKENWKTVNEEVQYLTNVDPLSAELDICSQYIIDLKLAYQIIKDEFLAVTTYADAVNYIKTGWHMHIPPSPLDSEQSGEV